MSVALKCPQCNKSYTVTTETLGRRVVCKSCGERFVAQAAQTEPAHANQAAVETAAWAGQDAPPVQSRSAVVASGFDAYATEPPPIQTPLDQVETLPPSNRMHPGKRIGTYVVARQLGRGAMGEVWLARDAALDRDVAIKVLPPEFGTHEGRLTRFMREAKLAAKVQHPNVVIVFQAGTADGLTYLVMEYVNGGSLDCVIQPMPWREATRAIRDAAAGLAAAHAVGLVHRDIKPANLMRTVDGVTKVADFGLARALEASTHLTQEGAIVGTPLFMAPELWEGAEADTRSDVYALVCTYYYLLTGQAPFNAPSLPSLGYLHRHEPFPDIGKQVSNLPDDVHRILVAGAAKNAGDRIGSAASLQAGLDALLSGTAPATDLPLPPQRSYSTVRSRRKRKRPQLAIALVLVIGILAATLVSFLAWTGWRPGGKAVADGNTPARQLTPAEIRIEKALDEVSEPEFIETPLQDFLDYMKDGHGINVEIDTRPLADAGISLDLPITRNTKGVTLKSVLNLTLRNHGMMFVVWDESLVITTPEGARTLEQRSGIRSKSR